jgi:hypothetical protein
MKKILTILVLCIGIIACKNQDNSFPDFDYTSGFFPYQYPVRTLVLGDYIYDNTNDNNHEFLISAAMGGVYANKMDRIFDIELAPELCNRALFSATKDTIRLMPASYYTLSSSSKLTIPAGSLNGNIRVHLNDAFFDDPLAIKLGYVIPIKIKNVANLDTILRGKSGFSNPDPRIAGQWSVVPKDYTMFAVNYINPYHGKYLHRGVAVVKDGTQAVLETTPYRTTYIVNNEIWSLVTLSKNSVNVTGTLRSTKITGSLNMNLTFTDDGNCTITQGTGSAFTITGSGKFVKDGDEWGLKKRDAIYMNYQLTSGGNTYSATDTLVIRDRAVKMVVFTPTIY